MAKTLTRSNLQNLPGIFRTADNERFINATLDQLTEKGQSEAVNGYVGRQDSINFKSSDVYIDSANTDRFNYQLEPGITYVNDYNEYQLYKTYDDFLNQIVNLGGYKNNHNRLFNGQSYAFAPPIDFDKFANFREYYWLQSGPDAIIVKGSDDSTVIDIDYILERSTYTSPNGVIFSNGLKVRFEGDVLQSEYKDNEYYVEGVGIKIRLVAVKEMLLTESYGTTSGIPFDSFLFDTVPFDQSKYVSATPDYLTINKSSIDRNAWSRSNRWVHKEVIEYTAEKNGHTANLDETLRATRPIIEFTPNLKLYNHGVDSIAPVDLIDFKETNAFNSVSGQTSFYVDGKQLDKGDTVIFAADTNLAVRSKVYTVDKVTVNSVERIQLVEKTAVAYNNSINIKQGSTRAGKTYYYSTDNTYELAQQKTAINQAPLFDLYDSDGIVLSDTITYPASTFTGNKIFSFVVGTGTNDGVLGFPLKYQNIGNFGDIVFESCLHTDTYTYSINNVTYTTNAYRTFFKKYNYVRSDSSLLNGWAKQSRETRQPVIKFYTVAEELKYFKLDHYKNCATLTDLEVSVYVNNVQKLESTDYQFTYANGQLYLVFNKKQTAGDSIKVVAHSATGIKDQGFYPTPINLNNNPLNSTPLTFTFGEVQTHVATASTGVANFRGTFPGAGNLRDLGELAQYAGSIVQHEDALPLAMYHITNDSFEFDRVIFYAAKEYEKFKKSVLDIYNKTETKATVRETVDAILKEYTKNKIKDSAFYNSDMLAYDKNKQSRTYTVIDPADKNYPTFEFYDDTAPANKALYVYVNDVLCVQGLDYTVSSTDTAIIFKDDFSLNSNDKILLVWYADTSACFVPATPTKLGMWPKYEPKKFTDDTIVSSDSSATNVIQGHDGSVTRAYNDGRDDVILEIEKRIYNNLKADFSANKLNLADVEPGKYRTTQYTKTEYDNIYKSLLLKFVNDNDIDIKTNSVYDKSNPFTYSYRRYKDADGVAVRGYWRGIYKDYYDTDRPHTHPWEMLGYTIKPTWWDTTYGESPYTSGNTYMWTDLKNGYKRGEAKTETKYARSGLLSYIPTDSNGALRNPLDIGLVPQFPSPDPAGTFVEGDHGPGETVYRRSSVWPFYAQLILAVTKPARYFAKYFDPSRNKTNTASQYVYGTTGKRFALSELVMDMRTTPAYGGATNGYHVLVNEYLISKGLDPHTEYHTPLKNLNLNLIWRCGGFIDKNSIDFILNSHSSTNSLFVPKEDFDVLFYVSKPVKTYEYSGVIVEKTATGWKVTGYGQNPKFNYYPVLESKISGTESIGSVSETVVQWQSKTFYGAGQAIQYDNVFYRTRVDFTSGSQFDITNLDQISRLAKTGGITITLYNGFQKTVKELSYGTEFKNIQEVVNFLLGYQEYLKQQGFRFSNHLDELNTVSDWTLSAKELAYWSLQNWAIGSVLALSPASGVLEIENTEGYVQAYDPDNYEVLKQDGTPLSVNKLNVKRLNQQFTLSSDSTTEGIYYVKIKTFLKEHCVVFENSTVFNDILFEKQSGARQTRLKVQGFRTANWNGDLYAPGFIFDKAMVEEWSGTKTYYPGDLVVYQNKTYTSGQYIIAEPDFDFEKWNVIDQAPEGQLLPNFDTKAEQFRKFYDLEINNFDADQEKFATHLYGYQPRSYLTNLLIDNTAQYKFYQGYIREKGSLNALNKLLRSQTQGGEPDIQVYEQWMFRQGELGAVDTKELLEISLDSDKFLSEKTTIKLLDNGEAKSSLQDIVSLEKADLYSEPFDYTSNHFGVIPALYNSTITYSDLTDRLQKIKTAGYVDPDEVKYKVLTEDQIQTIDFSQVKQGDAVWVAIKNNRDWGVLRLVRKKFNIVNVELVNDNNQIEYTCDVEHNLNVNDIIYIQNVVPNANGIKTISSVVSPTQFQVTVTNINSLAIDSSTRLNGRVLRWDGVRYTTMDELENIDIEWDNNDVIYVDNDANNKWVAYQKQDPYTLTNIGANDTTADINFGSYVDGIESGDIFGVSAPNLNAGVINIYARGSTSDIELIQSIQPTISSGESSLFQWGTSFAFNSDATEIVIGGPTSLSGGMIVTWRRGNDGLWTKNQEFYSTSNIGSTGSFGESVAIATPSTTQRFIVAADPTNNRVNTYKYSSSNDYEYNQQLSMGNRDYDWQFGKKVSLSADGHWLAISSPKYEAVGQDSSQNKGAVFIYKRGDDSSIATDDFFLVQTLTPDYRTAGDEFGSDITLSKDGTTLAISSKLATNDDSSRDYQEGGKVYIYTKTNNTFTLSQTLRSRNPEKYEQFGNRLALSNDGSILTVQSKNGTYIQPTDFDVHQTYTYPLAGEDSTVRYQLTRGSTLNETPTTFDNGATRFTDPQTTAGRVYVYKKYNTKWIYDNELKSTSVQSADNFGSGMAIMSNKIVVGASNDDTNGSNTGYAFSYGYTDNGWKVLRQQSSTINVEYLYGAYVYDKSSNVKLTGLDFFDPIKKQFPTAISNNIRYYGDEDPAQYNLNDISKESWRDEHVGELWWDLSQFRYIDYEQSNTEFRKTWWGKPFDGAQVKILEWIKSSYPPTEYNRIAQATNADAFGVYGIPKDGDNTQYSTVSKYDPVSGQVSNTYYYWIINPTAVPNVAGRTLAASEIANYLQDPQQRDNSWIAIVNQDEILLNGYKYLVSGTDRILAIESSYEPQITTNLHTEWQLIGEGNPQSLPSGRVLKKFKDSLIGYDTQGNKVPDPKLKPSLRYGIRIRPRQSWFADRTMALKEIIVYANDILKTQRVVGSFDISDLLSGQPQPATTQYNQKVATVEALNFLVAESFDSGYKVLVANDSTIGGGWNLYQWTGTKWNSLAQQTWSVTNFWEYKDWYANGYDSTVVVNQTFASERDFAVANINVNEIVKIDNDGSGKWVIRIKNADDTFTDIGAESSTIQIKAKIYDYASSSYGFAGTDSWDNNSYDAEPTQETKVILDTLYEKIFTGELAVHANKIFFLAVRYAIQEQRNSDWVIKSSFIDAKNTLSTLDDTAVYNSDNQTYFEEYIKEIKPYKTKIKNFVNAYDGSDIEDGIFSDFDNPVIYDSVTQQYRPTSLSLDDDSTVWNNYPHRLWKDNYKKSIDSIIVGDGGANYREAPTVTISGGGGSGATATAKVANGKLQSITVTNSGSGYTTTPTVTLTGGAGTYIDSNGNIQNHNDLTAAKVYPVLENRMVRDIKTVMKFDRITTGETITTWEANTAYTTGQYIVHSNVLYSVATGFTSTSEFDDTNLTRIAHGNLQNAIDRIYAFYQPTANQSGLDYSLLMQGIAFPGISVTGQKFSEGIGWDGAGWVSQGWDTWELEDGVVPVPTDDTIDTNLTGGVMASALGTAPDDIIADGQDFKSPEHNGGPEELLPGQMFDTLDIQVYHAPVGGTPVITTNRYQGDGSTQTFSLTSTPYNTQSVFATVAGVVKTPGSEDSTHEGGDITVDVENKTVTFSTAPADGSVIDIKTMGVGGRNIVAMQTFTGDGSTVDFTMKADYYNVTASYITVNGVKTAVTLSSVDSTNLSDTVMTFSTAPANGSVIQATLFSAPDSTTSFAEVEVDSFLYDGSTRTFQLDRAPSIIGPLHAMVVVTKNGSRLTPPDTVYYTADGSTSSFIGPDDPNVVETLSEAQIEVHVNGVRKLLGSDYYWIQTAGLVDFNTSPSAGDVVAITAKKGHEYEVIDNTVEIQSSVSMSANDKIAVYSFTNHDDLEIRTEVFAGTEVIPAQVGYDLDAYDVDPYGVDGQPQKILTNKILLSRDIIDNSYVWVSLNGTVLAGGVDFRINENDPNELLILKPHTFTSSDRIVVTYFSEVTALDTIAFRIFKDMMNRHHYRRIADSGSTTLTQALNITDTHVYVADASKLPAPDPTINRPGVVFINGERMIYWVRDTNGNFLTRLFRGTMGTGAKTSYPTGTRLIDATANQALPQTDTFTLKTFVGDGSTTAFDLGFNATSTREFEVVLGGSVLEQDAWTIASGASTLTLNTAPVSGRLLRVLRKTGHIFYTAGSGTASDGVSLTRNTSETARFLRKGTTDLP